MKIRIGTNTKMFKNIAQTTFYLNELGFLTKDISRDLVDIFVIPSYTALEAASKISDEMGIMIGAQNMGWADEGQFTGEISPVMLKEVGVQIVEIGHSERRHILNEDDEMENRKVHSALRHGLTPLLCIGETSQQKACKIADEVLRMQLKLGLRGVSADDVTKIWVAYEPVWAIGVDGIPATSEYAEKRHQTIRKTLEELYDTERAKKVSLLYGGSVDIENACDFIAKPNVDGLFVGRSAWDAEQFNRMIRKVLDKMKINTFKN